MSAADVVTNDVPASPEGLRDEAERLLELAERARADALALAVRGDDLLLSADLAVARAALLDKRAGLLQARTAALAAADRVSGELADAQTAERAAGERAADARSMTEKAQKAEETAAAASAPPQVLRDLLLRRQASAEVAGREESALAAAKARVAGAQGRLTIASARVRELGARIEAAEKALGHVIPAPSMDRLLATWMPRLFARVNADLAAEQLPLQAEEEAMLTGLVSAAAELLGVDRAYQAAGRKRLEAEIRDRNMPVPPRRQQAATVVHAPGIQPGFTQAGTPGAPGSLR